MRRFSLSGKTMDARYTAVFFAKAGAADDYRRWAKFEGDGYAHTMNPLLGRPSRNRLAAVTVLESSCMLADAWASALLVLGENAGVGLAQTRVMDALFVLREGEALRQISVTQGNRQPSKIGRQNQGATPHSRNLH